MKSILALAAIVATLSVAKAPAADARDLYTEHCAKCHGADGKGKTKMGQKLGARDYTDAQVQASVKDEDILKSIKEGFKDKDGRELMKATEGVSDDDLKALVAYMRGFKK